MLKNRPSRTALKVALNIVTLGSKPGMAAILPPGIVEATRNLLIASGAAGNTTIKWAQTQRAVSLYETLDWILPGQFEAFAFRKAFCERHVRYGIETGATQILFLGAGYDTAGWRLAPDFPHVLFLEIDHPATARLKAKGIAAMGARDNLLLIPEDLGKRKMIDLLNTTPSWDKGAQTVIVAEGILMYLTDATVQDLFCQCATITGTGSRTVFSYVPSNAKGQPDAGRFTPWWTWIQKITGEPWLWSINPDQLAPFLEKTGWQYTTDQAQTPRKYGVEHYAVAFK